MNINLKSALPAAAIAALGYVALASGASASVTSDLNKCRFDTKQKVVECCEKVLRDEAKPQWMISAGSSCRTAAKCFGKASFDRRSYAVAYAPKRQKQRCFITMRFDDGGGNDSGIKKPQRPQRQQRGGPNNF